MYLRLDNCGPELCGDIGRLRGVQLENTLHHRNLCGRGAHAAVCRPIVHCHAGAQRLATPVDCARYQRHLQKTGEFILFRNGRLWVHEAALVGQDNIRADQDVVGNRLPEHLHVQDVPNNLLRLLVQVRVHQSTVVVARNHIAQGRQTLLHSLQLDIVW